MDFQKMKQLVDDGSSSSSSSKKLDGVKGPNKPFDLNLLPEDSEEDRGDEFYLEILRRDETPQFDLNLIREGLFGMRAGDANSNGLVLPQSPAYGRDKNDASIFFNNTITSSSATKMVTPTPHPFDDKRKVRHNGGSSANTGTPKSLRPRRPELNDDGRICTNYNCRTKTTPMWRRGPLGPKTLCNACGIQYKKQVSSRGSDLM